MSGFAKSKYRAPLAFGKVCGVAREASPHIHATMTASTLQSALLPIIAALSRAPTVMPVEGQTDLICRYTSRSQLTHRVKGVYYGFKYQCVEFARRWLTHAQGTLKNHTMPPFKTLSLFSYCAFYEQASLLETWVWRMRFMTSRTRVA